MKVIKTINKFCYSCLKEHDVQIVELEEENIIRNETVTFRNIAEYCIEYDELNQDEDLIRLNDIAFKNAYRKKMGLLLTGEIKSIRDKYSVSQADLSKILGWGEKTITRYESYQIQDIAHDDLLRRVEEDPEWFLRKIEKVEDILTVKAFTKYKSAALHFFSEKSNAYSIESIESEYSLVGDDQESYTVNGLDLNKVTTLINYLADKVDFLYMTRTMKMLWYADALHFKRHGKVITGLAYTAEPIGALPMGYKKFLTLDGINCVIVEIGDNEGFVFEKMDGFNANVLSEKEKNCIDTIIEKFEFTKTKELIDSMHNETAYKNTEPGEIISFKWAAELSID